MVFVLSGSIIQAEAPKEDFQLSPKVMGLIQQLQGGYPQEAIPYVDAPITDLDGKEKSISDYEGKVIFLNLWATWCPPCRAEMPSMDKLQDKYKDKDFVILGVAQGEDLATVKKFLKKNPYRFPIFTDTKGRVGMAYSTGSIPTSYLIDRNGNIVAQFVGAREWHAPEMWELIDQLLTK
jgi:thiol-disulfide isomerase/thioredoxin